MCTWKIHLPANIYMANQNWKCQSDGPLLRYLYISIIICRFSALISASFYVKCSTIFFSPVSVSFDRLILLFLCTISFSCFIVLHSFSLQFIVFFICHRHRCTTVACRTLSRFDSSLVFFMLFQFNGYFLLLLLECWKIATYFNQKQKMGKKNWNRPNLNQYFFYVCRAHQFFFLGLWTFARLWPLIRNQQLQWDKSKQILNSTLSLISIFSVYTHRFWIQCWIISLTMTNVLFNTRSPQNSTISW